VDPAALQVLISKLTGVAEEMGAVLRRAAFSPNIKERADCSAALFTADQFATGMITTGRPKTASRSRTSSAHRIE